MQCHMDELPDFATINQYTGVVVTGSHCSANDSQQWIHRESDWLCAKMRSVEQHANLLQAVLAVRYRPLHACFTCTKSASQNAFLRCQLHCIHDLSLLLRHLCDLVLREFRPTHTILEYLWCITRATGRLLTNVDSTNRSITALLYFDYNACSFWHQAWEEQWVRIHLGNLC